MNISRRFFMKTSAVAVGGAVSAKAGTAKAESRSRAPADPFGCLVDLTQCVGCRKCEQACNEVNHLPEPKVAFDDSRVLDCKRRPDQNAFTVVNRYYPGKKDEQNRLIPAYAKIQCMHCQDPACVSACIVGALTKQENGAVIYDKSKCIGCRYCMVACPFGIPAYEYDQPFTPEVRKCTYCFERISKEGGKPGCASVCPVEAITFGKRDTVLALAKDKIKKDPGRYINKVYGEEEVGGASWMYISEHPFEKLGFLTLPKKPLPTLPETIQHTMFKFLWAPITLFAALAGGMWVFNRRQMTGEDISEERGADNE
ncbi:4Fe-4S dicluster domain-containing protein [Desulfatibacillum aliphaticivorans]|uniref:4Fe-4S dicluster domain-containing protein n=1 Tax=Desulfatibacillum aliphaticivorans TaxID=218208 RepID=UPI0004821C80|nr:4Fe-4S dicluster domain-containing protein [Desulfatibacillum aliphaticivorans]